MEEAPGRPCPPREAGEAWPRQVSCIHSIYFLPQTLDFLGLGA